MLPKRRGAPPSLLASEHHVDRADALLGRRLHLAHHRLVRNRAQAHDADALLAARDGEALELDLLCADDRVAWQLVLVGDLDLLAERPPPRVYLDAQPRLLRLARHLLAVRQEVVGDGQQPQLDRRDPEGEVSGGRLDQHAEEALERAEDGAVQHDWLVLLAVGARVLEAEALGQVEVRLDRRALPQPADGVLDLDVDLRAVEGAAALVDAEGPPLGVERILQRARREGPDLVGADGLLGASGEHDLVLSESELGENLLGQVEDRQDLSGELRREAEDVRVVLREAAYPEEAVERARALVPVDSPQLRPPDGEVAVRARRVLENQHVEGAVHRLDLVLRPLHLHLVEHVVFVELVVARRLPQVDRRHVRRVEQLVPAAHVRLLPVLLHQVAHRRALGVPEDQPSARRLLDGEEVELLAESAVVSPPRLRLQPLVLLQLLLRLPRRAVHPLQHRPVLVAEQVGPRDRLELDRLRRQVAGGGDVRPRAQVPPAVLLLRQVVDRDAVAFDPAEDLQLVRLVLRADAPLRLLARDDLLHEGQLLLDDLVHLLLDPPQVFVLERLGRVEVVVEALLDPRADGDLRALVERLHRHRHHVRRRVADAKQPVALVVRGEAHRRRVLRLRLRLRLFGGVCRRDQLDEPASCARGAGDVE
mmetsp:Transcript_242/g.520  ORF Transcript_242/g.520 Transcript_242/m.520 type:complete len:650 (-) Transcript_242:126-2075(-)